MCLVKVFPKQTEKGSNTCLECGPHRPIDQGPTWSEKETEAQRESSPSPHPPAFLLLLLLTHVLILAFSIVLPGLYNH